MVGNKTGFNDSIEERRITTPMNGAVGFRVILVQRVARHIVCKYGPNGKHLRGSDCSAKSPATSRSAQGARFARQFDAAGWKLAEAGLFSF
jgi:hypothetical protein